MNAGIQTVFEVYRFPAGYLPFWYLTARTTVGPFRRFLDRMRRKGKTRVLDVGSGGGWNSLVAAMRGFETTSLDVTTPDLKAIRQVGKALDGDERTRVVAGDGRRLPFADATFDVILSSHVIEHVENPAAMLQEIERVLMPGGWLWLFCPSGRRWMKLLGWFGIDLEARRHVTPGYDKEALQELLPLSLHIKRTSYRGRFIESNVLDLQMVLANATGLRAITPSEGRKHAPAAWLKLLYPLKELALLILIALCKFEDILFFFTRGSLVTFEIEKHDA